MDQWYEPLWTVDRTALADLLDAPTRVMTCGPGFDPEDQDRLLDLFLRRDEEIMRYAIMLEDRLAGTFEFSHRLQRTVVGFCTHRDLRGRGIIRRAWQDLGRDHAGPEGYAAFRWLHNMPAARVLTAMGFQEDRVVMGHEHPVVCCSLKR